MPTGNKQVTYCCRPSADGKKVVINTTSGGYVNTISGPEFTSVVIQGEEVIFTLKNGKTAVYTVRGSYKGTFC